MLQADSFCQQGPQPGTTGTPHRLCSVRGGGGGLALLGPQCRRPSLKRTSSFTAIRDPRVRNRLSRLRPCSEDWASHMWSLGQQRKADPMGSWMEAHVALKGVRRDKLWGYCTRKPRGGTRAAVATLPGCCNCTPFQTYGDTPASTHNYMCRLLKQNYLPNRQMSQQKGTHIHAKAHTTHATNILTNPESQTAAHTGL